MSAKNAEADSKQTATTKSLKPEQEALALMRQAADLLEEASKGKSKHADAFGFISVRLNERIEQLSQRI